MQMCLQVPENQKAQPLPGLPDGWFFYFVNPEKCEDFTSVNPALTKEPWINYPVLQGLRILRLRNNSSGLDEYNEYDQDIESTLLQYKAISKQRAKSVTKNFYEKALGITLRISRNDHFLVNKPFCRRWMGSGGIIKEVYGLITSCGEDYFDRGERYFTVRYDCNEDESTGSSVCQIPKLDEHVSETMAWRGCILYDELVNQSNGFPTILPPDIPPPFLYQWLVPTKAKACMIGPSPNNLFPQIKLQLRGYELVLTTKKSGIPNAGMGLWLKCNALSSYLTGKHCGKRRSYFELQPGELLDLGPYAPLCEEDQKDGTIFMIKNYIHNWECESWSFEVATQERKGKHNVGYKVLDVTDDSTGEIRKLSRENALSYINETDGVEKPSVLRLYDPEGAVHYLLGYPEKQDGPLRFSLEQETELKIDYGDSYEKERIRKGYSRLSKEEQEQSMAHMSDDVIEMELFKEIKIITAREVEDSTDFLERIFSHTPNNWPLEKVRRALIIAILLKARLQDIRRDFDNVELDIESNGNASFCDNGYTSLGRKKTFSRVKKLVLHLCNLFPNDKVFRTMMLKEELGRAVLTEVLKCNDLYQLDGSKLREEIASEK